MTDRTWAEMNDVQKAEISEQFVKLEDVDRLSSDVAGSDGERRTGFSDLMRFILSGAERPSSALAAALLSSPQLRQAFSDIMARQSLVTLPRAAAASSGEIDIRQTDGVSMKLISSDSMPGQIYLLIERDQTLDTDHQPTAIFLSKADDVLRRDLPETVGGTIQLLLSVDDPLVALFRDPGSEVYLM